MRSDRRSMGTGWASSFDPRRLRGQPRSARRAAHRPLPPCTLPIHGRPGARPCAPSPELVDDGLVDADRCLQREPPAAATRRSSSPRSRPCRSRCSLVRRPALRGGIRRPLRRGRDRAHCALAARRIRGAHGGSPVARRALLRSRQRARSAGGRSLRSHGSRPRAERRGRSRSAPTGDRALGRARRRPLRLDDDERARLGRARPVRHRRGGAGDVVLVMGVPGPESHAIARTTIARGYLRLNRDERGGSLRDLAEALDEALAEGSARGRPRQHVPHARLAQLRRRGGDAPRDRRTLCLASTRRSPRRRSTSSSACSIASASSRTPEELKRGSPLRSPACSRRHSRCAAFASPSRPRTTRALRAVEHVPFVRASTDERTASGVLVAARCARSAGWAEALAEADPQAPHLVFDWRPDGTIGRIWLPRSRRSPNVVSGPVEAAICPHPGGAPICWCRVPLPGLALAFARRHGIDPGRSTVVGTSAAHRTLATALGARLRLARPGRPVLDEARSRRRGEARSARRRTHARASTG